MLVAGCGGGGATVGGGGGGGNNSPTTVTFTFQAGTPTAVATKIGSGSFTAQTLSSSTVSLSIPSGTTTFAIAYVCGTGEFVYELSIADGTSFTTFCPANFSFPPTATLTGSLDASAISGAYYLNVFSWGSDTGMVANVPGLVSNFSYAAPAGSDRVEVLAYTKANTLVAAKDFPSQTVPGALNGGNTVVFSPADEPASEPITYNSVPPGYGVPSTLVGFLVAGSGIFGVTTSAQSQYPVLPAGAVESGDMYRLFATAFNSSGSGEGVGAEVTLAAAGPASFTFPAPWVYGGPTPAATPTFNFEYAGFSGKTGVIHTVNLTWLNGSNADVDFELVATANYLNGSTTLAVPDLSGVSGFPSGPSSREVLWWQAAITQGNEGVLQSTPPANIQDSLVENSGSYLVP